MLAKVTVVKIVCGDVAAYIGGSFQNSATYTHQQGPTNIHSHSPHTDVPQLAILTTVTLASTSNTPPDDGVAALKYVGAVLM